MPNAITTIRLVPRVWMRRFSTTSRTRRTRPRASASIISRSDSDALTIAVSRYWCRLSRVNDNFWLMESWGDVMALKIHLLARNNESSPGYVDSKTYTLGTDGAASAPVAGTAFKRRVFSQMVRLVNPGSRRDQ